VLGEGESFVGFRPVRPALSSRRHCRHRTQKPLRSTLESRRETKQGTNPSGVLPPRRQKHVFLRLVCRHCAREPCGIAMRKGIARDGKNWPRPTLPPTRAGFTRYRRRGQFPCQAVAVRAEALAPSLLDRARESAGRKSQPRRRRDIRASRYAGDVQRSIGVALIVSRVPRGASPCGPWRLGCSRGACLERSIKVLV
jgi:hypothetical protein